MWVQPLLSPWQLRSAARETSTKALMVEGFVGGGVCGQRDAGDFSWGVGNDLWGVAACHHDYHLTGWVVFITPHAHHPHAAAHIPNRIRSGITTTYSLTP